MNYVDLSVFVGTLLDLSYHARYLMKRVESDAIALNPVRLLPTGKTLRDDVLDNCATAVVHVVFLSVWLLKEYHEPAPTTTPRGGGPFFYGTIFLFSIVESDFTDNTLHYLERAGPANVPKAR